MSKFSYNKKKYAFKRVSKSRVFYIWRKNKIQKYFLFVSIWTRMQVEVSKHTEGAKEKTLRPNGLPESLIRYDGIYSLFSFVNVSISNFQIKENS